MSVLNLNETILCGRLTADIELKTTTSGKSVVTFTIAVNRPKSKDGEQKADFISCVAWDKTAEFIKKYFGKGDSICITGTIQTRTYKRNDGSTAYVTEVNVGKTYFVDGKQDNSKPQNDNAEFEEIGAEDLPF